MKKTINPFIQILSDFWNKFKQKYPGYSSQYYDSIIEKTIGCGDPTFGYIEYGCTHCGGDKHRIAFTCKTKFCLRCGRVNSENFVKTVMDKLHPGVVYRHLILTVPEQLYQFFYRNRHQKDLYNNFYKCGWDFIQNVYCHVTKRRLKTGAIVVLHTTGRKSNYRPHLHIIVMNGGIDVVTGEWVNIPYFPYEKILPKKWQYFLLKMIADFDKNDKTKKLISLLYKKYKNGFVNFFMNGDVPQRSKHLVKYLSKYLFRPMISVKRILKYDHKRGKVSYEYQDHRSKEVEIENIDVMNFIGRMAQQILPKGFQRARYYGLQSNKSFEKSKKKIISGQEQGTEVKNTFKAAKYCYSDRMKIWLGRDPLVCKECGHSMELVKIWSKEIGVIYDLLELYSKASQAPPMKIIKLDKIKESEPLDIVREIQLEMDFSGMAIL